VSRYHRDTTTRDRHRATIARTHSACHICGEPIDYSLRFVEGEHRARCTKPDCAGCKPHPLSFVVDHIVPLSKGGTDTLDNKAASHRSCNAAKAARLVAPIVRRCGSLD
jgi:5-methylcytosine-specific restriction endonuclease McrA